MKTRTTTLHVPTPWKETTEDVLRTLGSSENGLVPSVAEQRRREYGPNVVQTETSVPGLKIFVTQFSSPLVLILMGASCISFALGDRTETIIILVMIGISGLLSFTQEYRSERALRSLRQKLHHKATVIRHGISMQIDSADLVLGDIVELNLGSLVTADLRLLKCNDLEIDEAIITGESVPVLKSTAVIAHASPLPQDQVNMAFLGTHVSQGSGLGIVVRIGTGTEVGRTAALLAHKTEETDFQKGIHAFGNFLLRITVVMALVVAGVLGFVHGQWAESLLFGLALAVGISPELLPLIVTINLSRGALALSAKHVLVKRLSAIEDLGNADIFCTDKTGTLTVGKIRFKESIDAFGASSELPLAYASACIDIGSNGQARNSIDEAIADAAAGGRATLPIKQTTYIDQIAFDFHRRRMSVVLQDGEKNRWLITKGAVTEVMNACTLYATSQSHLPRRLLTKDRTTILACADSYQTQGYRVIAVARRHIEERNTYAPADEHGLELLGFILVYDAPKQSAKAAIRDLERLNVQMKILTGDNEHVALHIADQLHFPITGTLTGDQLEKMDESELQHQATNVNLFARITPEHKLRIIQALQHAGHTVGYMGDGVNDAPALRAADVGISFDDAVDVAKEAASILLLKKNLSVLANGIIEGRKTFVTTMTYIRTTISSNFGNMLSVAGVALFLPFIPLLPAQILLLNLLSDIPMLMLWTDRVADDDLQKPKQWSVRQISLFMYFFGSISSIADYATFGLLLFVAQANIPLFRSAWFVESIISEIVIIFLFRTKIQSWKNRPSLPLVISAFTVISLAFAIVQSSVGATFFFTPLPSWITLAIIGIVLGYGLLTALGKSAYNKFRIETA